MHHVLCCCLPPPVLLEACCHSDGSCSDVTVADCIAAGGTSQGLGSDCITTECPPPPADTCACCIPKSGCVDLPPADCLAQGGTPKCCPAGGIPCPTTCASIMAAGLDPCPAGGCPTPGDAFCTSCPNPAGPGVSAILCRGSVANCGACACAGVASGGATNIFATGCGGIVFFGGPVTLVPPGCPPNVQLPAFIDSMTASCFVVPPGGTTILNFCGGGGVVGFIPPGPHWIAQSTVNVPGEANQLIGISPFIGQCITAAIFSSIGADSCGPDCFFFSPSSSMSMA